MSFFKKKVFFPSVNGSLFAIDIEYFKSRGGAA